MRLQRWLASSQGLYLIQDVGVSRYPVLIRSPHIDTVIPPPIYLINFIPTKNLFRASMNVLTMTNVI